MSLSTARRRAIMCLCQAQAEGRLSVDQFEERYVLVGQAETTAAIEAIVADLGEFQTPVPMAMTGSSATPADLEASRPTPPPLRLAAVLGGTTRAGYWEVPDEIGVLVFMGEATLDLRDAAVPYDSILIDCSVNLGTLKLIVPPGTQIESECSQFMGSTTYPKAGRYAAEPNGLLVVVRGRVFMGELKIQEKPPSGTEEPLTERLLRKVGL